MNSDISARAIFCAKQNTMNLYRPADQKEGVIEIPRV